MLPARNKVITLLISTALLLGACGPATETGPTVIASPLPATATEPPDESEPTATPTAEPTPTEAPAAGWVVAEDPRTGIRFAVPCFWQVRLPSGEQDPSGLGSFPVTNYDDAFLEGIGDRQGDEVWEAGGMKIDFVYFEPNNWGLTPEATLREFAGEAMGSEGSLSEIVSLEDRNVNGQEGLEVATRDVRNDEVGRSLLFRLDENLILGLSPVPGQAYDNPDIQGILLSVALTPETEVAMPSHPPAPPPSGEDAPCLEEQGQG